MIAVSQEIELPEAGHYCFVGELALDGRVRSVKGVLPIAIESRKRAIIVPAENVREAAMVSGIEVYGVHNLREAFEFLLGQQLLTPVKEDRSGFFASHQNYDGDFADVRGQHHVKRAIEVAISGSHNLFILWSN